MFFPSGTTFWPTLISWKVHIPKLPTHEIYVEVLQNSALRTFPFSSCLPEVPMSLCNWDLFQVHLFISYYLHFHLCVMEMWNIMCLKQCFSFIIPILSMSCYNSVNSVFLPPVFYLKGLLPSRFIFLILPQCLSFFYSSFYTLLRISQQILLILSSKYITNLPTLISPCYLWPGLLHSLP